jgi:ferric-dicitrate binding protein FerR (iron transport regulator)
VRLNFCPTFKLPLVCWLAFHLASLPAGAAPAKPIGMVTVADKAHLEGANAVIGADVYPGDTLQTDPGGTLRVKAGSTQLYLATSSSATFEELPNQIRLKLTHGTLGFSSSEAKQFVVETPVATVRSADGKRAFGEVTIVGADKILVAAYHGALVVERNGQERIVKEGDAYNVSFLPDAAPGADPVPTSPKQALRSGSLVFDLIVLGGAAFAGYEIWHHLTESDSAPQH